MNLKVLIVFTHACFFTWIGLGILIPFTIGLSTLIMPVPILGLVVCFFLLRKKMSDYAPSSKDHKSLSNAYRLAQIAVSILVLTLGIAVVCILIGAIVGLAAKYF